MPTARNRKSRTRNKVSPLTAATLLADLETHHIEGIAREGHTKFSCPLITPIDDRFWQGGCIDGVNLQGYFQHIVSLYQWERFKPGCRLKSFTEVRMFDEGVMPDVAQVQELARLVNECRKTGRTLVHCQAGLNRSGLVAGLALVLSGMTPVEAIAKLRRSRSPAVLCNKAFEAWLLRQKGQEV